MNHLDVAGLTDRERATLREADLERTPDGIEIWFDLTFDNVEDVVRIAQVLGSGLDLWTPPPEDTTSAPMACLLVHPAVLESHGRRN